MEQEQQVEAPVEQQAINSTAERQQSVASNSASSSSGGATGEDPNDRARHFKQLSDTSIQAREAERWQAIANTSPQAQQGAQLKASAQQKADRESPVATPQETGIPHNLQTSLEYSYNISLKEVRVYYDSPKALEAGMATVSNYPNIYVATGKKKELGVALKEVAQTLQEEQNTAATVATPTIAQVADLENAIPAEVPTTPTTVTIPPTEGLTTEIPTTETDEPSEEVETVPIKQVAEEDAAPEGAIFNNEKPVAITPRALPRATSDSGFKAVSSNIQKQGDLQQKHQSSKKEVSEAQKAAPEANNRKNSVAQGNHLGVIEQKKTPAFETNTFVDALMKKVDNIMPSNQDEAENFKSSGKVKEVKQAVAGTVSTAKKKSLQPLEQVTQQQPNVSGVANKSITPLGAAEVGRKPQNIEAKRAIPMRLRKDRVEQPLQNDNKELDQVLANNDMSDEQLETSNEPQFQAFLEQKKSAEAGSEERIQQIRDEENKHRTKNKKELEQLGGDQMDAMHQNRRTAMTEVHSTKQAATSGFTVEEQGVGEKINSLYEKTKGEVERRLSRLDSRVQQEFDNGAAAGQRQFERFVAGKMQAYKQERYDSTGGTLKYAKDFWVGLPDEVDAFFVEGRNNYVRYMRRVIQNIAKLVARELNAAKKQVQLGRQTVTDYVQGLPSHLSKVGKKAAQEINSKFSALDSQVDDKQKSLVDMLAKKYTQNIKKIDAYAEKIKQENRAAIDLVLEQVKGPWEEIQKVKAMLTGALNAAAAAIEKIILDPIGFLDNLIAGVKQGFSTFLSGIQEHLTGGFVEWLTNSMGKQGIEMPADVFSLEGIFSIASQALNLTWDFVRGRAVKAMGEGPVQTMEEGFEIFQVIQKEGIVGAWEHLKEGFADLQETIMDSMMGMLIGEVVEAGIKALLAMLTPAGAFVKAAMMIVDLAQFFINQGSQLVELVNAFTASISAMAEGKVSQVASAITTALKISVPVLIGFLAALAGVGDLAKKVQNIFKKIKQKITDAIDGFIEKGKKWFKDKKGRRKEKKEKKKAEADADKKKKDGDQKDTRSEAEKKKALEKGMKRGKKIIEDPAATTAYIIDQLKEYERKYPLTKLDATLKERKQAFETWTLSGKVDKKNATQTVKRPNTTIDIEIPFRMNGEQHTLYFRDGKLLMASKLSDFIDKLRDTKIALDSYSFASDELQELSRLAQKIISKGSGKNRNKNKTKDEISELANTTVRKIRELVIVDRDSGKPVGTLDDLSREAVERLDKFQQEIIDEKAIKFVASTTFTSNDNALGHALIVTSSGDLAWVNSSGSSGHVEISTTAATTIQNAFVRGDTVNRRTRGPATKVRAGGATQINLEIKPASKNWHAYDRKHPNFDGDYTGYCNYHINVI